MAGQDVIEMLLESHPLHRTHQGVNYYIPQKKGSQVADFNRMVAVAS